MDEGDYTRGLVGDSFVGPSSPAHDAGNRRDKIRSRIPQEGHREDAEVRAGDGEGYAGHLRRFNPRTPARDSGCPLANPLPLYMNVDQS